MDGRLMNMLKCCLNWKAIAGLAGVALGLWLLAPAVLSAALPLLVVAICPLSMIVMMKAMQGQHDADAEKTRMAATATAARATASTDRRRGDA